MQRRPLGRTGITVSALCLGSMTWGQQNTEAEGHAQMDHALEAGIDFIDTSELYAIPPKAETHGASERIIGSWLAARGCRNRVVIASKVVGRDSGAWFRDGGIETRLDRAQVTAALEASLRRLRIDTIDLYQLHWPDRQVASFGAEGNTYTHRHDPGAVPIEETLGVLGDLVTAGKVRAIGLSNETAWGTMRFLAAAEAGVGPRIASIQNAYSLVNRSFAMGLAEIAMREAVGLLAYSALGQGFLTGKYQRGARPAGSRMALFDRGQRYQKPGTEAAIDAYLAIAAAHGLDPAQMALAFATSRAFTTSTILGATTIEQLRTAIGSQAVAVTPELRAAIDAAHQLHGNPAP